MAAEHGREMQHFVFGDLRQLLVRHGHVGGAEIDCAFGELADSATRNRWTGS